jgi:DNA-directed RNA polymerase specialized sigma24 family protein
VSVKRKFRAKLIEILVAGTTARAIAEITGVNQNTVRGFLKRLRKFIATKLPDYAFSGEAESRREVLQRGS